MNNYFFVGYLRDASSEVRVYALNGTFLRNIDLTGIGTVTGFNGRRRDKETFFTFEMLNSIISFVSFAVLKIFYFQKISRN